MTTKCDIFGKDAVMSMGYRGEKKNKEESSEESNVDRIEGGEETKP